MDKKYVKRLSRLLANEMTDIDGLDIQDLILWVLMQSAKSEANDMRDIMRSVEESNRQRKLFRSLVWADVSRQFDGIIIHRKNESDLVVERGANGVHIKDDRCDIKVDYEYLPALIQALETVRQ